MTIILGTKLRMDFCSIERKSGVYPRRVPDSLTTTLMYHYVGSLFLMDSEEELISRYFEERQAHRGTREQSVNARRYELSFVLNLLHKAGKRLDTITTQDALGVFRAIRSMGPVDEGGDGTLSRNYSRRVIVTFKSFLTWYADNGGRIDTRKIKPVKAPGMDFAAKKKEDLLTREEIERVLTACTTSRDRAIIATLYDGSLRPGEVVGLKWGDLIRDDYGIRIVLKTPKTGKERPIRFVFAVPYINQWENDYPLPIAPTAPVFLQTVRHSHNYAPLTYAGLAKTISRLRKRTGINKLTPSIFRPSKITHDVEEGTDLQYVMLKNWGTMRTPMIDVYAKPGKDYVDRVALEKSGIAQKKPAKKTVTLAPKVCPECQTLNPANAAYCVTCGYGLTPDTRARRGTVLDVLADLATKDPEGFMDALKTLKKS
ncbi:MAG: tyrosine-type recombinase/integrase [Methanolinea sp.]|nr:tyrosine-type recombinase/integrase [Methanolinea sp.]